MREKVRSLGIGNDAAVPWDGEIEIRALWRAIWVRRWRVRVPTLLAAVAATGAVNVMTPTHKSEARVLIEGREHVFLRPDAAQRRDRDQALLPPEGVPSQLH